MATIERMPKSGYTMREGLITRVLFQVGDAVKKGEPVMEYETDKLTGEVSAGEDGTILHLYAAAGETVAVLAPLFAVGSPGEKLEEDTPLAAVPAPAPGERRTASPAARKLAQENGIDLSALRGTGPDGSIQKKDVLAALQLSKVTHLAQKEAEKQGIRLEEITGSGPRGRIERHDLQTFPESLPAMAERRERLTGMRRTIGERLTTSKQTIPHAYYSCDADATAMVRLRDSLNQTSSITINDIILMATARALRENEPMRTRIEGDEIIYSDEVHIGIAVRVEKGLLVPVLPGADSLSLGVLSQRARELIRRARQGELSPDDYNGGTFTVSNLGSAGIRQFCAIINPPETGILAVGAVEDRAVALEGKVVVRKMVTLTLSADHRLIDGAQAAAFLMAVKKHLEQPLQLLL